MSPPLESGSPVTMEKEALCDFCCQVITSHAVPMWSCWDFILGAQPPCSQEAQATRRDRVQVLQPTAPVEVPADSQHQLPTRREWAFRAPSGLSAMPQTSWSGDELSPLSPAQIAGPRENKRLLISLYILGWVCTQQQQLESKSKEGIGSYGERCILE